MGAERMDPARAALTMLVLLPLVAAVGCSQREPPSAVEPAALAFARAADHPASGHLPARDVAVWRQPGGLDQDRYYAAVGNEGIMVHLADGAFLQRLAQSAASHLAVLYAMPVDEAVADFLVAVDPTKSQLTWFEINAGSGALRRLAGQPAEVGGEIGGLCAHYDVGTRRHQVVVVTRAGELQDWTAVAHAGRQPNFANRIIASRDRTLPLGGAGGDCAVDASGDIFVVVDGREVRRVNAESTTAADTLIRSGAPASLEGTIAAIDVVTDGEGQPVLLIADQDGRRVVATDASGRLIGSSPLGHTVSALETGGDSVAIVADGGELRLGTWRSWAAALGIRGGRP